MSDRYWELQQPGLFDRLDPPDVQNRRVYEWHAEREREIQEIRLRLAHYHQKVSYLSFKLRNLTGNPAEI